MTRINIFFCLGKLTILPEKKNIIGYIVGSLVGVIVVVLVIVFAVWWYVYQNFIYENFEWRYIMHSFGNGNTFSSPLRRILLVTKSQVSHLQGMTRQRQKQSKHKQTFFDGRTQGA